MSEGNLSAPENEQLLLREREERVEAARREAEEVEKRRLMTKQLEDLGHEAFERVLAERRREHLVQAEIDIIYHRVQKMSRDIRIAAQEGRYTSIKEVQDEIVDPALLLLRSNLDTIQMLAGVGE